MVPQYGLNEEGASDGVGPIADQVVVNWRHIECHIDVRYGQEKLFPDSSMSRIRVSMGVLPTNRTKNSCSMTWKLEEKIWDWLKVFVCEIDFVYNKNFLQKIRIFS